MRYGTELSTGTRSTFIRFGHSRTFTPMTFAERRVLGDLGESLEPLSDENDPDSASSSDIELELDYVDADGSSASHESESGSSKKKDSESNKVDHPGDAKTLTFTKKELGIWTVERGLS